MREDHLITAPHTLENWPKELYLTDPVFDRENRETWEKQGSVTLEQRAVNEVEERLVNYTPIETDPAIDEAMRAIIKDGFEEQESLPDLPPPPEPKAPSRPAGRRGRAGRRRRS